MTSRTIIRQGVLASLITDEIASTRKSICSVANTGVRDINQALLTELNGHVPALPINGYAALVNYAPSADRPIHRWFWYREGYSQELVRDFIKELPRGAIIVDPFCGAGTTLIAAREMGYPTIGMDVNPISTLVSRVKTTPLSPDGINAVNLALVTLESACPDELADLKPALKIIEKVFQADILNALLIFRRIINETKPQPVRDFLFVGWLSILEKVSNVYKEGNGIKYKNRKRTNEGYISVDMEAWAIASFPTNRFEHVKSQLLVKLTEMLDDLALMPSKVTETIVIEDGAENVANHIEPNSVALAIFSPPYCNCFNYFKMYKVELWMGGFVNSYEELRTLNGRALRSHVEMVLKKTNDISEPDVEHFAKLLDSTQLWDKRIPNAVRGYFIDMASVLRGLHTVLKPSGKCVIVVGNSAYGGVVIPTDALLAKIAGSIGFKVEKLAVARHLTTSSQQRAHLGERVEYLRESLLVLKKEDPRLADKELDTVDEIPLPDNEWEGKVFLIRNSKLTAGTHKFHRYPGKFIPHIPRWALQRYGKEATRVLDPFCGSGTTLVETLNVGVQAIGIDVDPIGKLVSRVKTTHIFSADIENLVSSVSHGIAHRNTAVFKPVIPTLSHWFTESAINDLGIIRDEIELYRGNRVFYEFLLVCLISVIRRVSNADNQTQKTYVSHTKIKTPEPAVPLFLAALGDYSKRVCSLPKTDSQLKPIILENSNAMNFAGEWNELSLGKVDLVITSPPYLNSVDYVYNQMAEYFWIGDLYGLENQPKQNIHKEKYIGTTKLFAEVYSKPLILGISSIDEITSRVSKKSVKNGYIVAKYFSDMLTHFREVHRVMLPGAKYVCVVGDSLVSGESIPVHELLAECASLVGFELDGQFGYEIRNRHMRFPRMGRGGIVRYDWVLVLSNSKLKN